jgi:hypothetical protein
MLPRKFCHSISESLELQRVFIFFSSSSRFQITLMLVVYRYNQEACGLWLGNN